MGDIFAYGVVFLTGMLGIWKAIPVGMALGLGFWETSLWTALGSSSSAILLFIFGRKVKKWLLKHLSSEKLEKRKNSARKLTSRYGLTGLALLGSGMFGPIGCRFWLCCSTILTGNSWGLPNWALYSGLIFYLF